MLAKLIAVGIALLFTVAVSASKVQEVAPPPEAIDGLKNFAGEGFEDVSESVSRLLSNHTRVPYFVYLHVANHKFARACGGTLIHDDIVLTAARCLYYNNKPWSLIVAFGGPNVFFNQNLLHLVPSEQRRVVLRHTARTYHPLLNSHDIALLKLEGSSRS